MFLSISIPIFNAEKTLDKCIESVMEQTFNDFELILVDDGSKDESLKICQKWKNKFPENIKVIKKENTGSLLTRRECLEKSSGEYIYIMDADDYLLDKTMFSQIKDRIDKSKCDLIFFDYVTENEEIAQKHYNFGKDTVFEGENLLEIYKLLSCGAAMNNLWNKVFSRRLVDWGADYSKYIDITNATDMFQVIPIIFNAKKIEYIDRKWYFYKTENNINSIVHKFRPTIYVSLKTNYLRLLEYCTNSKWYDKLQSKLDIRFYDVFSTSVYMTRLIKKVDGISRYQYIKNIGEDDFFRKYFNRKVLKDVVFFRKIIIYCLYYRQYRLLSIATGFLGLMRR